MSNIKTFRPNNKPLALPEDLVRAVKVTEKNLISVKDWIGEYAQVEALIKVNSKGDTYDHRIRVKTPKGWRVARVGDWLVLHRLSLAEFQKADINKYPKASYAGVAKDEFLREHTETTYKEAYNHRESVSDQNKRCEEILSASEAGVSEKELGKKYKKSIDQIRTAKHIARVNRRLLAGE